MNKFLRIITTAVIGVGLILLFLYLCVLNNADKADVFSQPSYYVIQNYWYVFLAGCGCIAFSLISCFLSWHKSMDTKVEILPNAVAAQKDEVVTWLSGSSLDTRKQKNAPAATMPKQPLTDNTDRTQNHVMKDETAGSALSELTVGDNTATQIDSGVTVLDNSGNTIPDSGSSSDVLDNDTVLENSIFEDGEAPSNNRSNAHPRNKKGVPIVLVCGGALIVLISGILFFGLPEGKSENAEAELSSDTGANVTETTEAVETTETVETTEEKELSFTIEVSDNAMDVSAENLSIHVENERNYAVTISGLSLKDTYTTNMSTTEPNMTEYAWQVELNGMGTLAVATTSFAINPGEEQEKALQDMQHSVWEFVEEDNEEESYYQCICDAEMSHTENSMTWTFSIPENYIFDFSETRTIDVSIWDLPNDIFVTTTYVVETE